MVRQLSPSVAMLVNKYKDVPMPERAARILGTESCEALAALSANNIITNRAREYLGISMKDLRRVLRESRKYGFDIDEEDDLYTYPDENDYEFYDPETTNFRY